MYSPEITFYTGDPGGWLPTSITQPVIPVQVEGEDELVILGGYRRLVEDGTNGPVPVGEEATEVAEFAEMWARNIEAQGWFGRGKVAAKEGPGEVVGEVEQMRMF